MQGEPVPRAEVQEVGDPLRRERFEARGGRGKPRDRGIARREPARRKVS